MTKRTIKEYEFWWHNMIDGNQEPDSIVEDAEFCLSVAKMLKESADAGAIELIGGDSSPSLTRWDVLNEEQYKTICAKYELDPESFAFESEDEFDNEEEGNNGHK